MSAYTKGTNVQYHSQSTGRWMDGQIIEVRPHTGEVQVSVKPGYWMPPAEQQQLLRRAAGGMNGGGQAAPQPRASAQPQAGKMCFVIGGQQFWASSVQEAMQMASGNAAGEAGFPGHGHNVGGWPEARTVESLDPKAREYFKCLSLATSSGGVSTFNHIASKHFKDHDTNGDGKLDLNEFKGLLNHLNQNLTLPPPTSNLAESLFSRYDLDGSASITQEEFNDLYKKLLKRILTEFKVCDKEHLLRGSTKSFQQKYELGKRIAAGAQGVTYLAKDRGSGQTVVVKKPNDVSDVEDFEQVRDKSHPNLVRVFELFHTSSETYVVMECCGGGDLFGAVGYCKENFGNISMDFCRKGMMMVMSGAQYIHSQFKECHNDIKPENVLLDRKPKDANDVPRFMLADFGCASGLGGEVNGDPRYNAPELWRQPPGVVCYATDVWACGVMIYEMLSGGLLVFTDHANISGWAAWSSFGAQMVMTPQGPMQAGPGAFVGLFQQRICTPGAQPDWRPVQGYSQSILQILRGMLTWDQRSRMTMPTALQSQWFKEGNDGSMMPGDLAANLGTRADYSDLKMLLLNMVASKLQGENLEYYQKMWNQFDQDRSGMLNGNEFITMLASSGMDKGAAEDMFALADIDGSGDVDFNEFVAVMFNPDKMDPSALTQHLCYIFTEIAGGDRSITAQELSGAFPGGSSGPLVKRMFQKMDKDGSGSVSQKEFEDFLSNL